MSCTASSPNRFVKHASILVTRFPYCSFQITNNPKPAAIMRALELISLSAGIFVPSPNLYPQPLYCSLLYFDTRRYGPYEDFLSHLPNDVTIGFRSAKKQKKTKKDKKKKEDSTAAEVTEENLPEQVTKWASEIHRRMEITWHAVGERECAPSFLEMDAVKVFIHA